MSDFDSVKEKLRLEYKGIADIVFMSPALAPIEHEIRKRLEVGGDVSLLVQGYAANVIVTAREYLDHTDKPFKVVMNDNFLTTALKTPAYFNENDQFIGEQENTIVAIPVHDKLTVDLCFGVYNNIKAKITSPLFVIFYRKNITDKEILILIKKWVDLPTYQEKRKRLKELISQRIVFLKDKS